ncbi:unnamed protein product, partial [Amoebophrya sp. A120]
EANRLWDLSQQAVSQALQPGDGPAGTSVVQHPERENPRLNGTTAAPAVDVDAAALEEIVGRAVADAHAAYHRAAEVVASGEGQNGSTAADLPNDPEDVDRMDTAGVSFMQEGHLPQGEDQHQPDRRLPQGRGEDQDQPERERQMQCGQFRPWLSLGGDDDEQGDVEEALQEPATSMNPAAQPLVGEVLPQDRQGVHQPIAP